MRFFKELRVQLHFCAWLFGTTKFTQGKDNSAKVRLHLLDLCCDFIAVGSDGGRLHLFEQPIFGHGRYKKNFPCHLNHL